MEGNTNTKTAKTTGASDEQRIYASVLGVCMRIGLVAIVITFILYLTGLFKPHVPVDQISQFWGLKGDKYLEEIGVEKGWSWLTRLSEGDFLNFLPIAFLASVTALCYLVVIPTFLKKKDVTYAVLAVVEVLILVLAASGVLPSGGH